MASTPDLFQSAAAAKPPRGAVSADYSAKDIEILEGLEPVRRRPAMYIGGTDAGGSGQGSQPTPGNESNGRPRSPSHVPPLSIEGEGLGEGETPAHSDGP